MSDYREMTAREAAAEEGQHPDLDRGVVLEDTVNDLMWWMGADQERQAKLLRHLLDQLDWGDLYADEILQGLTGKRHINGMVQE